MLQGIARLHTAVCRRVSQRFEDDIFAGQRRQGDCRVEATLLTPNAPFDKYLRGNEGALSGEQKAGLRLFIDKGCAGLATRIGARLMSPFGVVEKPGADLLPLADKGRFEVTRTASDEYVFKVPTLRNIALTAPSSTRASRWDLEQAIGVIHQPTGPGSHRRRGSSIAAFLLSLTGEQPQVVYPILPPSTVTRRNQKPEDLFDRAAVENREPDQ